MAKDSVVYTCETCGHENPKWLGQCPSCGGWNTLVTGVPPRAGTVAPAASVVAAVPMSQVGANEAAAVATGVEEFDRAFGGGLVPGSVTLLSGEPGVGKSTLLLQVAATAAQHRRVLYLSGEESVEQLRRRAGRIGAVPDELWVAAIAEIGEVVAHVDAAEPEIVVVDSIQTLRAPGSESAPGSVAQVRACTQGLVTLAKSRGVAVIVVGHVTKDGAVAGPRTLEHLVDTVASVTGESNDQLRVLRTTKHRFGSTQELGVFEMTSEGLLGVPDASGRFLSDRRLGAAGSVVASVVEGNRTLLVEVQALVVPSAGAPRRSARGIESARLAQLLAVLERFARIPTASSDVYVSVVGGLRVNEPAIDLAVVLAVASNLLEAPLPADLVAWGEVGLGGELRQVSRADQRLAEAARLGFARALVPEATLLSQGATSLQMSGVRSVVEALQHSSMLPGRPESPGDSTIALM